MVVDIGMSTHRKSAHRMFELFVCALIAIIHSSNAQPYLSQGLPKRVPSKSTPQSNPFHRIQAKEHAALANVVPTCRIGGGSLEGTAASYRSSFKQLASFYTYLPSTGTYVLLDSIELNHGSGAVKTQIFASSEQGKEGLLLRVESHDDNDE